MSADQIAVLLIFIGFYIGGTYLIKKANIELNKETTVDTEEKDNMNK